MSLQESVENYLPRQTTVNLAQATRLVFLVGIAGAGKNTLASELLKDDDFQLIVSHTTRAPRTNNDVLEVDGQNYHFISSAQAQTMIDGKEFVEVKYVHGTIYGTSVAEIQNIHDSGKIGLADIDVQGVDEYMALSSNITPIFILPPDYQTWQSRFISRYGDAVDQADILKRRQSAIKELRRVLAADYYHFVINDEITRAASVVRGIAEGDISEQANQRARQVAIELLAAIED